MDLHSSETIKQIIKAEAQRLGFSLIGFTAPTPPPHQATYLEWLDAGRHAEMAYLSTERAVQRRSDPSLILPECRSVLVLGIRYAAPTSLQAKTDPGQGRVAAYAWGDDYHEVLVERLRLLASFIRETFDANLVERGYTDTGPILERDLAQQAGLGWAGKNTCLINPRLGSYFLLAELFLSVDLEPDVPFKTDACGSCRRCIDACPTGCILPDRTIDAGRCISYLTIEKKGPIPLEQRNKIGSWVFGCDVCQMVCPWNIRFASPEGDPAFAPRADAAFPVLEEDIQLTPEAFNRKFKRSPIQRARRRGYLRNIAIALGNQGRPQSIPVLATTLQNEIEPIVRGAAAWALGQIGTLEARQVLENCLQTENEESVLEEIKSALAGFPV